VPARREQKSARDRQTKGGDAAAKPTTCALEGGGKSVVQRKGQETATQTTSKRGGIAIPLSQAGKEGGGGEERSWKK